MEYLTTYWAINLRIIARCVVTASLQTFRLFSLRKNVNSGDAFLNINGYHVLLGNIPQMLVTYNVL